MTLTPTMATTDQWAGHNATCYVARWPLVVTVKVNLSEICSGMRLLCLFFVIKINKLSCRSFKIKSSDTKMFNIGRCSFYATM